MTLKPFFPNISINLPTNQFTSFEGINNLLLTDLKTVNLFVGKNGCGKSSILEAIDEQMIESAGLSKSIWNKYQGARDLNLEMLKSAPEDQFPVVLLIDDIETRLHHTEFSHLWISLIDFAISHSIQLFVTTHSYECIADLVDVCKNQYPGEDLVRLFRIEKNEQHEAYGFTQEQLAAAIESRLEVR